MRFSGVTNHLYTDDGVYYIALHKLCDQLAQKGFQNIDALDPAQAMLNIANRKGIYQNLICDSLGPHQTSIQDGKFTTIKTDIICRMLLSFIVKKKRSQEQFKKLKYTVRNAV